MTKPTKKDLARAVLAEHGRTYAKEAGLRVERGTPAELFQLLVLSILLSARIAARNGVEAARALRKARLTTARHMADATWQQRVDVLTAHGYKRYDESAARMLGDTAELVLDRYDGDLRKLRDDAERDVATEHRCLQQFKGIGDVGADIFLREVQVDWDEVFPYADDRVLGAAHRLGLGDDVGALADLVSRSDYPRLAAGLVRLDLDDGYDRVRERAAG